MIVQKTLMTMPPGKLAKRINKKATYVLDGLNEIGVDNIKQIIGVPGIYGHSINGYIVFYEDKGVCACPGCGHDISNTFSFCPNCGYKMYADTAESHKCPTCNRDISDTFNFCPNCSVKLK